MSAQVPLFRPELVATPEEEGGTAYVRITDPATGRTTRLYALEYDVARAMDGRRSLSEVAAAVSSAQGITPSLADLAAFVAHLEGLGLVIEGGQATADSEPTQRVPFWSQAPLGTTDTVPAGDPLMAPPSESTQRSAVPLDETATLGGREALLHNEATQEPTFATEEAFSPVMTRPTVVLGSPEGHEKSAPEPVHHGLEGSDTRASPEDGVHAGVYAMVTEELDLHGAGGADGQNPPRPATGSETPTEPDPPGQSSINVRVQANQVRRKPSLMRRLMPPWLLAILAFGAVAGGVLYRMGKLGGPIEPDVSVRLARLEPRPRVASQGALEVQPARQVYLPAPSDGTLGSIADANTLVAAGDIVAALRMPDEEADSLDAARDEVSQANTRLKELTDERARLSVRRKDLQSQQLAPQGESRRRSQRQIARQLVAIDRRDRTLRIALVDAKSQHARAAVLLAGLEKKLASYLVRAPFAGIVGPARVAIGVNLRAGQPLVALEDRQQVTLTFAVPEGLAPTAGEKTAVLIAAPGGAGVPLSAVVDELLPAARGPSPQPRMRVAIVDEHGALAQKPPHAFRLVTGQIAQALWVPLTALGPAIDNTNSTDASIWCVDDSHAVRERVEVIERREDGAWVSPRNKTPHRELSLIIASSEGMTSLAPHQAVHVQSDGPSTSPDAARKNTSTL